MPWIRLIKSHTLFTGKKLPVGKLIKVDKSYAKERIDEGVAVLYIGPLPPHKMKTEFFKPKIEESNGNTDTANIR